jgi:hypothetical protein
LYQSADKVPAERFTAFLLEPLRAPELNARAAFRFSPIQPGTYKIISATLDV